MIRSIFILLLSISVFSCSTVSSIKPSSIGISGPAVNSGEYIKVVRSNGSIVPITVKEVSSSSIVGYNSKNILIEIPIKNIAAVQVEKTDYVKTAAATGAAIVSVYLVAVGTYLTLFERGFSH